MHTQTKMNMNTEEGKLFDSVTETDLCVRKTWRTGPLRFSCSGSASAQ